MSRSIHRRSVAVGLATCLLACSLYAQPSANPWHQIGNASLDLGLAGLATGAVDRVWYSSDGSKLYAQTPVGRTFVTTDFERWTQAAGVTAPAAQQSAAAQMPEGSALIRGEGTHLYAVGSAAYRSEDGGLNWSNLTRYRGDSLIGSHLADLAVSPENPEDIAVASSAGVWRSLDGGLSWIGLNQFLPNLPGRTILALPAADHGLRIGVGDSAFEWAPGEKQAWRESPDPSLTAEATLKSDISQKLAARITAVAVSADYVYAGSEDGRLWVSASRGSVWSPVSGFGNPVEAIYVNAKDPRIALAALGTRSPAANPSSSARVLRTMNGGGFWDDVSANLPDGAAHGVTADVGSGAAYVATDSGVFMTFSDLASAGRPTNWILIPGLPSAPVLDVKLDPGGNQLFAAVQGFGIYASLAPHRIRDVRVVSAADFATRAAAPGGLLSVIGANVRSAQIGNGNGAVPVLDANDSASQIQVPFTAQGSGLSLSLDATSGRLRIGLPLLSASPGIFVDPDGSPLILDESGVMLDRTRPARAGSHIQILATGLGRVSPDWPAGVPAPLNDPPRATAPIAVLLNNTPLENARAALAPGYVGFYLIEAEVPALVNEGPASLRIEVQGQVSNTVRVYLAP